MRIKITILLLSIISLSIAAQEFTLAECRQLALQQNNQAKIDRENIEAAKDVHRASVAKFFPKLSVNGAYQWNEKNLYLLPDEAGLNLGPNGWQQVIPGTGNQVVDQKMAEMLSSKYEQVHEATELNIEHLVIGYASVTQPIFVGGKLIQAEKLAKSQIQLMEIKAEKNQKDLITSVDEAYWRVLTVESKYELAEQYLNLLKQLESDVTNLVEIGLATNADLLKVRVKRQEAEMSYLQATNGLQLSKMALCQLCGLDINYDIHLHDDGLESPMLVNDSSEETERSELRLLEQARDAAHTGVMMAASTLMPNVVAKVNYLATNPSLHNGFKNNFSGMFTVGVVVNIPIAHADNIYEVKAAKHAEQTLNLQLEEAKEKIHLQATQAHQAVELANAKLLQAEAGIRSAEENMRYADESFKSGLIGATDLMMAQTAWMQARTTKIEAACEARLAEVNYLKYSGKL